MAKLLLNKVTGQMVAVYAERALLTPDILEEGHLLIGEDASIDIDLTASTEHAKKVLADSLNATKTLSVGIVIDPVTSDTLAEIILPTELDNYIVLTDTRSQASRDLAASNVTTAGEFAQNMDYFPVDEEPADDGGSDDDGPKQA